MAALAGGTAAGQLLLLIASPIITRLYTPADLSLIGLVMAFVGVVGVAAALRYEAACVGAQDDAEAARLVFLSLMLAIPGSVACGLALIPLMNARLGGFDALPNWTPLAVMPLIYLLAAITALRFFLVRRRQFGLIGKMVIAQSAGRAATPIVAGLFSIGWVGLLLGEAAGRLAGLGRMAKPFAQTLREVGAPLSGARSLLAKYWRYPALFLPSSLLNSLALLLPLPLVVEFYGQVAGGHFSLVQRLMSVPASLLGASVADVFHSRAVEIRRSNPAALSGFLTRTSGAILRYGALPTVLTMALAPYIFGPLFGSRWQEAGVVLTIMAPLALIQLVVGPVSRLVLVADRQGLKLAYDVAALVLAGGSLLGAHALGMDFRAALIMLSASQVAAYLLYFVLLLRAARDAAQ